MFQGFGCVFLSASHAVSLCFHISHQFKASKSEMCEFQTERFLLCLLTVLRRSILWERLERWTKLRFRTRGLTWDIMEPTVDQHARLWTMRPCHFHLKVVPKSELLSCWHRKLAHESVMIALSAFWQGDGSLGDNVRFFDYVRHFGACISWELWENVTCRHFQRIDICDHLCTCICKFVSIFRVKYCAYGVVCACVCCLQETGLHCLDNTLSLTFLSCLLSCYLQAKAKRWNAETLSNFQTLSKLWT